MALLDVRGVSKNFGAIKALTEVSLTMEPGEVVGLMGDNGAGKSTMVKLVAGNFPPSEGEVAVERHRRWALKLRTVSSELARWDADSALRQRFRAFPLPAELARWKP